MSKAKEGKVVRERLEEIFNTTFFYQPGMRHNGKWNFKIVKNKGQNCNSLEIYRWLADGCNLAIRTLFLIKFFCIDVDNKPGRPSIYYNNLQPILDCLDELGLEARLICTNTEGGRKIWVPLPITIEPQEFNNQLEQYFRRQGLVVKDGTLELLGRTPTIGNVDHYRFKTGGRSPYLTNVSKTGDAVRLPYPKTEYLQLNNFDVLPKEFTLDEFFGMYWDYCLEVNSEFNHKTICEALEVALDGSTGVAANVDNVVDLDALRVPASKCTKNQVSNHGGKRTGAGRKSGTQEERYLGGLLGTAKEASTTIQDALDRMNRGWTAPSQSMQILAAVAIVLSYTYRTYDEITLAREITSLAKSLRGYNEFASDDTKKDIDSDIRRSWGRRWAKCVLNYRKQLESQGRMKRDWDYALRKSENGYWIEAFSKEGKSRFKEGKRANQGKGRGGYSNLNHFDSDSNNFEYNLKKLEEELEREQRKDAKNQNQNTKTNS